jgi:hypothetical protein
MRALKKIASVLLFMPMISEATKIDPPAFRGGDAWTYEISVTSRGIPEPSFRQEYGVLWKTQRGNFLSGQRGAQAGSVWAPRGDFSPDRCLVFLPDLSFDFGSEFCGVDIQPGLEVESQSRFGKRVVRFEGDAASSTPLGFFKAGHFSVNEALTAEKDTTAPTAVRRVWDFWYVAELRGFSRMSVRFFDESGSVVRTVAMSLAAASVKP